MNTLTKLAIVGLIGLVLAIAVGLATSQQQRLGMGDVPLTASVHES